MAGVKQFDEAAVLARIMTLFWARGYDATSIDDLVEATGLKRGSLYNAYGGKEEMFLQAFDRYISHVATPTRNRLDATDAVVAIRSWLEGHCERMADTDNPQGCLATNACLEMAQRDDAIGRRVRDSMVAVESQLYDTLRRAQAQGYLSPGQDLRALARFFHGTLRGMALLHKATGDISAVRDMVDVATSIFDKAVGPAGNEEKVLSAD